MAIVDYTFQMDEADKVAAEQVLLLFLVTYELYLNVILSLLANIILVSSPSLLAYPR